MPATPRPLLFFAAAGIAAFTACGGGGTSNPPPTTPPTSAPTATDKPTSSPLPTVQPTATVKPTPIASPTVQPTATVKPTPTASPTALPTAGYVYVTNDTSVGFPGTAEVDYWQIGATGNAVPVGVIAGSNTGLFYGTQGIAVTASEIYVSEEYTDQVLGFPINSTGNVTPNVVIGGSQTKIHSPFGLALDSSDNLYVANCGGCDGTPNSPYAVEEFAAGSNGNVAPLRQLVGPNTQINYPSGLAVAPNGDLYVADAEAVTGFNPGEIAVCSSTANGDSSPERSIVGTATLLYDSAGIAVTPQGLFVESYPAGPSAPYILKFGVQTNGNAAPLASIEGSNTGIKPYLEGLSAGPQGATVYGVDRGTLVGGTPLPSILQFASNANGNVAPITDITGPNTRLFIPLFDYVR